MPFTSKLTAAFARNALFQGCELRDLQFTVKQFQKDSEAPALLAGEPALGLVVEGKVAVYSLSTDGTSVNLTEHKPGDCFGIAAIFLLQPPPTLLICEQATTIAYLPRVQFLALLRNKPEMFMRYGRLCNEKILFLTRKIEFLTLPSCRARLSSYLIQNRAADQTVTLQMSKEHLASMLGVSRATLYRELAQLKRAGVIEVEKQQIRLLQPAALQQYVDHGA